VRPDGARSPSAERGLAATEPPISAAGRTPTVTAGSAGSLNPPQVPNKKGGAPMSDDLSGGNGDS
jgi:hypothetical protein